MATAPASLVIHGYIMHQDNYIELTINYTDNNECDNLITVSLGTASFCLILLLWDQIKIAILIDFGHFNFKFYFILKQRFVLFHFLSQTVC